MHTLESLEITPLRVVVAGLVATSLLLPTAASAAPGPPARSWAASPAAQPRRRTPATSAWPSTACR
jgi:hypothetical protein